MGDSLTDFTGGVCESYDISDYCEPEKQNRLWKIIFQVENGVVMSDGPTNRLTT